MRAFIVFIILVFNFILQSTVFQYIAIFGIKPDTALVIIVCFAFLRNDVEAALAGLFAGLMVDLFFGRGLIGYHALSLACAGFVCGKFFKAYFRENYLFPLVMTAVSAFLREFATYVTRFMLLGKTDTGYYLVKIILPSTIYTTLLVLPVYWAVYRINDRLEARERRRGTLGE